MPDALAVNHTFALQLFKKSPTVFQQPSQKQTDTLHIHHVFQSSKVGQLSHFSKSESGNPLRIVGADYRLHRHTSQLGGEGVGARCLVIPLLTLRRPPLILNPSTAHLDIVPIKDPIKRAAYSKAYHKRWYEQNKNNRVKEVAVRKKSIREWMRLLKESLFCSRCGLSGKDNAWAMEFHHQDPTKKESLVSGMVSGGYAKARIMEEIEKCDVVCASCHRKEHYQEHQQSLEDGTESIWTAAGKSGAKFEVHGNDDMTRNKKRRRKRRQQRLREARGTNNNSGPQRMNKDDIDTMLFKMENGAKLSKSEVKRFRMLIGREQAGLEVEGDCEHIEFDTNINRERES